MTADFVKTLFSLRRRQRDRADEMTLFFLLFLRIMSIIEKTVARINQNDRLDQLILDLGRKHYRYKALPKYYELMGQEFIQAIQPVLNERWTSDLDEAWKTLFLYITQTMKKGYLQAQRNHSST